ncbi:MAG: glycoside hydrolase family 31 protein [Deltaproteobacteria bacterium]|nr:glycoside hydrolase family 31 protein [Deltaproteobacteria bacterium]
MSRPASPFAAAIALCVASSCGDDDGPDETVDLGVPDVVETPDEGVRPDAGPASPDGGGCTFTETEEPIETPPLYTPRWAFEPWISKDLSDTADTRAFVAGFRDRDIPVGAVVLDSPWATHYNSFVPNPERYSEFETLLAELHADDIRLVLWVTQFANRNGFDLEPGGDRYRGSSPNFAEGRDCGFYVNDGELYTWWKGSGGAVDFFHPGARAWWHRQQDALLDMGIDGWKLDFGEQYITDDPMGTFAGPRSLQEYSEEYYRDYWAYGVSRRGRDFVTMVRPWDESYQFAGRFYARPEHAPVAWVGDNRRDWIGLSDALDHIFRSAAAGYTVVGSDVGGYLDRDDRDVTQFIPFDSLAFARWVALGAMTPFMQLHGRANLAPWTVEDHVDETVALYRYWATLHSQLVPFLYSLAREAQPRGEPMIHPLGDPEDWPGDYRFMLGDAFLVAPILDESGRRDVELPDEGPWHDWWNRSAPPILGPTTLPDVDSTDRARIPLFVREGAIVPMTIASDVTGIGTDADADAYTILVYPAAAGSSFVLHEDDDSTTTIDARAGTDSIAEISLSRVPRLTHLHVRVSRPVTRVLVDGADVPVTQSATHVRVTLPPGTGSTHVSLRDS